MPCEQVSLSIGARLGNLEGVRLPGFFKETKKYFWVLSWTQRTLRF